MFFRFHFRRIFPNKISFFSVIYELNYLMSKFFRVIGVFLVLSIVAAAGYSNYAERQALHKAAEQRIANAKLQMQIKYDDITAQLETANAKTNKSKHDYWLISHLEKTQKHLDQYLTTQTHTSESSFNLKTVNLTIIENILMILIMVICFASYFINGQKLMKEHPQKVGIQQSKYRQQPNDSVANITSWSPMRGGGANFQTHKLQKLSGGALRLRTSGQLKIFFTVFIAVGLNGMCFSLLRHLQRVGLDEALNQPLETLGSLWSAGLMFVVVGSVLLNRFSPANTVFDKATGELTDGSDKYRLNEIHALQIIEEIAGGQGSSVFKSYELNSVFKNGERLHLMDHGHYQALNADAEMLAEYLGIPIWEV